MAPHHPGAACEAAQLCHRGVRPQAPARQAVPQRRMHRVSAPQPQHRQPRGSQAEEDVVHRTDQP